MIKVQHLTKSYGAAKALDDLSFEVKNGEIMGFLGPNGAGKTTTMKILTGYMPPTSGRAWVNEFDVLENATEMRRTIGYLPENNPLYLDFTVEEALRYVADVHGLSAAARKSAIEKAVEQCSLQSVYYRPTEALSKGFRQRVGLAQALVSDPKTLILDEPTVGLDPKQILEIRELIKKLGKDRTVLLSTHIMQEVQAICDRVTIIHQGKVVAQGTPAELQHHSEEKLLGSLYVKLAGTIKEIEAGLKSIPGVSRVEKRDQEKKGVYGYSVGVDKGADVRAEVFELAAKSGWKLYELTPEKISLEDVFLEVTK
jgi:ABC-2 type transport system ATP-binding protein